MKRNKRLERPYGYLWFAQSHLPQFPNRELRGQSYFQQKYLESYAHVAIYDDHTGRRGESGNEIGHGRQFFNFEIVTDSENQGLKLCNFV